MRGKKIKLLIVLLSACLCVSAQDMKIGTGVLGGSVNYCSYSAWSTNLCTLTGNSGTQSAPGIFMSYNYAVLFKFMITGQVNYTLFSGGIGCIDLRVGGEYHIPYMTHKPPLDLCLTFTGGYSYLDQSTHIVDPNGTFRSGGVAYGLGVLVRKYFGDYGIFVNANFDVHNYTGGEDFNAEGKTPYAFTMTGFNYGIGICKRLASNLRPVGQ